MDQRMIKILHLHPHTAPLFICRKLRYTVIRHGLPERCNGNAGIQESEYFQHLLRFRLMLLHGLHHGIKFDQINMRHHPDIIQDEGLRTAGKSVPVQNQICSVFKAGKPFFTGIQTFCITMKCLYLQLVQVTCTVYKLHHTFKPGQINMDDLFIFQIRAHIDTGHKQKYKNAIPGNRYKSTNGQQKSQTHKNLLPRIPGIILFCYVDGLIDGRCGRLFDMCEYFLDLLPLLFMVPEECIQPLSLH